ncbi:MAG: hypothetical protein AAF503_11810 [Pseudomonadota bacterium]
MTDQPALSIFDGFHQLVANLVKSVESAEVPWVWILAGVAGVAGLLLIRGR